MQEELKGKGVVSVSDLSPVQPGIYLWQGDITRLSVDAIVNAANSAMLGCFVPCHGCIDNAIHFAAGVELRLECARIMEKHKAAERYGKFLERYRSGNILFLELGVGYNTPGIIKYPFWRMTDCNPKAAYACVNLGETCAPGEIRDRSICINADIGKVLEQL